MILAGRASPANAAAARMTAMRRTPARMTATLFRDARALHWVMRVPDRSATHTFFTSLGFLPLRHEEFASGCEAECNGPYAGMWSKTMLGPGHGSEDDTFVLELTYNYGIFHYRRGNDVREICIEGNDVFQRAKAALGDPAGGRLEADGSITLCPPGGLPLRVRHGSPLTQITQLHLNVSDRARAAAFWHDFVGLPQAAVMIDANASGELRLGHPRQVQIALHELPKGTAVDHGEAYGRIAFSVPDELLVSINAAVIERGYTVLKPLMTLETPGKANVQVVIVADPDGYEVCFVGREGFKSLSQVDYQATAKLEAAISEDRSREWMDGGGGLWGLVGEGPSAVTASATMKP